MAFDLPALPYDYDALEPVISKETMTFHHDKHHKAYTDKLNEGVEKDAKLQGKTIEEILGMISSQPPLIRNNGGGFWNHDFFWKIMAPKGSTQPSGALKDADRCLRRARQAEGGFQRQGRGPVRLRLGLGD